MDIARKLYLLRTESGLTQAQLAEIAGVSDKAVSAWENGTRDPKIGPMQKVCDHFGIDVHLFINEDNEIYRPTPKSSQPAAPKGDELTDAIILGRDGKAIKRTYTKEQMEALRKIIDVMPYLDDEEL